MDEEKRYVAEDLLDVIKSGNLPESEEFYEFLIANCRDWTDAFLKAELLWAFCEDVLDEFDKTREART